MLQRAAATLICCAALTSCASDPMLAIRSAYEREDYVAARDGLLDLQAEDPDNAHLFGLELGIVHQAMGDAKSALRELRKARDRMDRLTVGSFTDWAGSIFFDDRSTTYAGADYEQVLVRAVLAVCDLMAGGHDAYAYAFQVLEKQRAIIDSFDPGERDSPKKAYKLVAFGNYLRAIINEQNPRDRTEAEREFAKVRELAPDFAFGADDLERSRTGRFAAPGHGVAQILAMVGRAPYRVEARHRPSRDAILIAQLIWAIMRKRRFVPNIVPLPIPTLALYTDNPDAVAVFAGGREVGRTATVTDVEKTAMIEFEALRPWTMARAVIRRVLKTIVVEGAKEVAARDEDESRRKQVQSDLIQIGLGVLGNFWAATEGADLRGWSLLPARFQALRVELPEGEHDLVLRAVKNGVAVGAEQRIRIRIHAGFNTYVLGMVPSTQGGPAPQSSQAIPLQR